MCVCVCARVCVLCAYVHACVMHVHAYKACAEEQMNK